MRSCVINFKGHWDDHFPLIEFSDINIYHSIIEIVQFEVYMVGGIYILQAYFMWLKLL